MSTEEKREKVLDELAAIVFSGSGLIGFATDGAPVEVLVGIASKLHTALGEFIDRQGFGIAEGHDFANAIEKAL